VFINILGGFLKDRKVLHEKKISQKIVEHAKEINKFQDKLFKMTEIEQVPPAVGVGGALAFAVSVIRAYEKEDPEMAQMLMRIAKRMFSLSGVEL
jgi:galactokinase/mevalonate kinase-like predicted kinase